MSSGDDFTAIVEELIVLYPALVVTNCFVLSGAAFLYYDYIVTLPLEISQIWAGNITITKVLFFVNRYLTLIFTFANVFPSFYKPATDNECQVTFYIYMILPIFINIAMYAIFILRTWVICERSLIVMILLLIPAIADIVASVWTTMAQNAVAFPPELQFGPFVCQYNQMPIFNSVSMLNFASTMAFDGLVVIFTVYQTARMVKRSREVGLKGYLGYILLRDGISYYSMIFVPTLIQLAFSIALLNGDSSSTNLLAAMSDVASIVNSLQVVMVNRLVLNLSYSANKRDFNEDSLFVTRTGLDPPPYVINSTLGNIGAPIRLSNSETEETDFVQEPGDEGNLGLWNQMDFAPCRNDLEMNVVVSLPKASGSGMVAGRDKTLDICCEGP